MVVLNEVIVVVREKELRSGTTRVERKGRAVPRMCRTAAATVPRMCCCAAGLPRYSSLAF